MRNWHEINPVHQVVAWTFVLTVLFAATLIVFVLFLRWRKTPPRKKQGHDKVGPDQIKRINQLTQSARTTWFGFLSFFAYIGITLLGVEHKDFFLDSSHSELPLIGISIPTKQVFIFGPPLGAAIFGYFHTHLVSLWREPGRVQPIYNRMPLSDHITPSLIADMALLQRRDPALRLQPLRGLSTIATGAMVFLAAPGILLGFWLVSLPAHSELITVVCVGIPLSYSIYVATRSAFNLWHEAKRYRGRKGWSWKYRHLVALGIAAVFGLWGWLKTEGTFSWYVDQWHKHVGQYEHQQVIDGSWSPPWFPDFPAVAELSGINFVNAPNELLSRPAARESYFYSYCDQAGIPKGACGAQARSGEPFLSHLLHTRSSWCKVNLPVSEDCDTYFDDFEKARESEWNLARRRTINDLERISLADRDLRYADLSRSFLQKADLRGARLEGSTLHRTRMEGADLRGAYLQDALLVGTRLEGANLRGAQLNGAYLRSTRFDHQTNFGATHGNSNYGMAVMTQAALKSVDLSDARITADQVESVFGDMSVDLPTGIARPTHWPDEKLDDIQFKAEWKEWRSDPDAYRPPQDR